MLPAADSFPRQQARTQRFRLGEPRSLKVTPAGDRVVFVRSAAGDDPRQSLWVHDVASGTERLVLDAAELSAGDVPDEERARRERVRESAAGVVDFALDGAGRAAYVGVAGDVWVAPLEPAGGPARRLGLEHAFDPRPDPSGRWVAWCDEDELWVVEVATGRTERIGWDADRHWGSAEFVAAEEMHRTRGFWWAPDGSGVLATAVGYQGVGAVWISDPARPEHHPVRHLYPMAGTTDADVSLWWCGLDLERHEIRWDRDVYPYLVAVHWPAGGDPLLLVERRDHHAAVVLSVEAASGATTLSEQREDPAWVAWADGTPLRLPDGRVLWSADIDDTRRLTVDGEPVTPAGLQVREVHGADAAGVVFSAWADPTTVELHRWSPRGTERLTEGGVVTAADSAGGTTVVASRRLGRAGQQTQVIAGGRVRELASHAEAPLLRPTVRLSALGPRRLRTGVLLPAGHAPGTKLPVLVRPYGGPGAQQVLASESLWLEDQWWADQGFAVVVADGRGTPGRGPAWEREVYLDVAGPVLEDQVDALHAAAGNEPDLDLGRVGIMGWSFGGYLAALAVLRRPDAFHAAVAGAPVTDWRLYDTYYTERHLGHPAVDPGPYDRCSLIPDAPKLDRPLLVIHGLADDNVLVAHSLHLSQALLEAGRPHAVLPLSGITHMATREDVAENLLLLQLDFLRRSLGDG